uniref:DUF19 domain-containing protein n=1 Tax=Panagrolaimus sp. JU765 TaxID=591449 RepID=A0AC34RP48_9BILA
MINNRVLISFFFFSEYLIQLIFATSALTVHCPHYINDHIQQCVQPVSDYAKVLYQKENSSSASPNNGFNQAIQFPKLRGQVFEELCRLIHDFETCVKPYEEKCPRHITINLIDASYGFLCNAGYETFMNSAECLMELDQRPSVKHCHDETLKDIEKANKELKITMSQKLDRMCEALNFFAGCVRHPIRHNCGLEAWQVIFRVLKDTTKTLMPACQFTGTSSKIIHEKYQINEATTTTITTTIEPFLSNPKQKPDLPVSGMKEQIRDRNLSEREKASSRRTKERTTEEKTVKFSQLESKQEFGANLALKNYNLSLMTLLFSTFLTVLILK